MSIKKSLFAATMGTLLLSGAALADLEVTPYGAAQYRLRFNHNMYSYDDKKVGEKTESVDSRNTIDYSNRLCLRAGLKAKIDDHFSAQFQFGNDWGAAENVKGESGIVGAGGKLYTHLAFFKWNPGYLFVEAGIVPLNSNGALDFIERSYPLTSTGHQDNTRYGAVSFEGWGNVNSSMPGLKLGMPLVKGDTKVGVELFQTVMTAREADRNVLREEKDKDKEPSTPKSNWSAVMTHLAFPVSSGNLKVTPEVVAIFNRQFSQDTEAGDLELAFGAAGSYKVNGNVSVGLKGGYATLSNEKSVVKSADLIEDNGYVVGANTSIKAGPGTVQAAVDFSGASKTTTKRDAKGKTATKKDKDGNDVDDVTEVNVNYLYTDLRYGIKLHKNVTFTPRYRIYTRLFDIPDEKKSTGAMETRFGNRLEMILEGSF